MQAQTQQPNTDARTCSRPGTWLPNEARGWVHKNVYACQRLLFLLPLVVLGYIIGFDTGLNIILQGFVFQLVSHEWD